MLPIVTVISLTVMLLGALHWEKKAASWIHLPNPLTEVVWKL
jgi:hypothetical protein